MEISTPSWFPKDVVVQEMKRMKALNLTEDQLKAHLEHFKQQISTLGSVGKVEVSTNKVNIVARKGLMKTKIGGDYGGKISGNAVTGYANLFKKGETFELKVNGGDHKHTFSFVSSLPLLKNADFSLPVPYTKFSLSVIMGQQTLVNTSIQINSLEAVMQPKGQGYTFSSILSMIQSKRNEKTPAVIASDPARYFKFALKSDLPRMNGNAELACTFGDGKFVPFLKANTLRVHNFGYNLRAVFGGGFILSKGAVPFPEKFRVGGVPVAYGIDPEKFGTTLGNFPSGCDLWHSTTLDFATPVLPQYGVNGHFFVNGAVSANMKSNCVLDLTPSVSKLLTAGLGLTYNQGAVQIQFNVQHPFYVSDGLKFTSFQVGVCPIE